MAAGKTISARRLAINLLNQFDPRRGYAAESLNRLINRTSEQQRATDIVFGTIRNRRAIDTVIAKFSGRPVTRIPHRLLNIIRSATYELIYRAQSPVYSVVNEAVENTRALLGNKQAGFTNAVLRNIARHTRARQAKPAEADATATLPVGPETGCQFDTPFLPDPHLKQADYLSTAFSLPGWLIECWLSRFGFEQTRQICYASNRRPSIYLRPNLLKTTAADLCGALARADIEAKVVPGREMIRIKGASEITRLPGFAEGLFSVQDLTAALAVPALKPQRHWKILDFCAAPGTKATQLAELTNDSAQVIATDIDPERLKLVEQNAARLGIRTIRTLPIETLERQIGQIGRFDAVLVDAPCSNTGVLARRIEARYRITARAVQSLSARQSRLLGKVAPMLKPTGRICYSTCSILDAENGDVLRGFLGRHPDFELESEQLILPSAGLPASADVQTHFDHDGGYIAVIVRR